MHFDVSEADLGATYEIVNVFDVLYHITDDAKFDRGADALRARWSRAGCCC